MDLRLCVFQVCMFLLYAATPISVEAQHFSRPFSEYLEEAEAELFEGDRIVVGLSLGVSVSLTSNRKNSLNAFLSIGIMRHFGNQNLGALIGAQSTLDFYRGGLGTSLAGTNADRIHIEMRNTFLLSAGQSRKVPTANSAFASVKRDMSSLLNPLDHSIAVGTIFMNGVNHRRNQQVGFGMINIGHFQAFYYNDATPFNLIWLSDAFDRFWTGGGGITVNIPSDHVALTNFELRYDNYTGYQKNLYEVSRTLNLDNLAYIDEAQQMLNRARWQLSVGLYNEHFISWNAHDPLYMDIQYMIHVLVSRSPFHARPSRPSWGLSYMTKQANTIQ